MIAKLFAHLRRQWMGALALCLVLSGGVAYAADTIFSEDIVNGEVKSVDIGNHQVKAADLASDAVTNRKLAPNSVSSAGTSDSVIPMFFLADADQTTYTRVLLTQGLRLSAKCFIRNGLPTLQVNGRADGTASLVSGYNTIGDPAAHLHPINFYEGLRQPLIPATSSSEGKQSQGTFTYTTPAGAEVTGTFQFWVGDHVTGVGPFNGPYDCLFSGIAETA